VIVPAELKPQANEADSLPKKTINMKLQQMMTLKRQIKAQQ